MKVYAVGGCIRDRMMNVAPKDYDYVVVGAVEQDMINLGYEKVGADFPVFLNSQTGSEYALARRERKTGNGYLGFECDTSCGNLNPELTKKFMDHGYDPEKEYPVDELIEFFQRISR